MDRSVPPGSTLCSSFNKSCLHCYIHRAHTPNGPELVYNQIGLYQTTQDTFAGAHLHSDVWTASAVTDLNPSRCLTVIWWWLNPNRHVASGHSLSTEVPHRCSVMNQTSFIVVSKVICQKIQNPLFLLEQDWKHAPSNKTLPGQVKICLKRIQQERNNESLWTLNFCVEQIFFLKDKHRTVIA